MREDVDALQRRITELEARAAQVPALEAKIAELQELVITDPLTGVANRRHLDETLALEVERSLRTGQPLGVLMVDVDHFRVYNNRYGHQVGDLVLRELATVLRTRAIDLVARWGNGDEFVVLLANVDAEEAAAVAERLRQDVEGREFVAGGPPLSISVGVAICPAHGHRPADLLRAADAALYRAKFDGRNTVRLPEERKAA